MVTAASGTGPPFSSVTRPERGAPETWARVGAAEKSAQARARDRQIHFANEEVQPLLNISFPLARSPGFRPGSDVASGCAQKRVALQGRPSWRCAHVGGITT